MTESKVDESKQLIRIGIRSDKVDFFSSLSDHRSGLHFHPHDDLIVLDPAVLLVHQLPVGDELRKAMSNFVCEDVIALSRAVFLFRQMVVQNHLE